MPRRVKNPVSEGKRLKALMDEGFSVQDIAQSEHLCTTAVSRRLRMIRLCPEVAELAEKGDIKFSTACAISFYDNPEDQKKKVSEWTRIRFPETTQETAVPPDTINGHTHRAMTLAGTVEEAERPSSTPGQVTMDDIRGLKDRACRHGQKRYALALARLEVLLALAGVE